MSETDNQAEKLDKWLVQKCKKGGTLNVSKRDTLRLGPSSLRKAETLEHAIETLAKKHRVRVANNGKTTVIEVNPILLQNK